MITETRPRQYAARIIAAIPDKELQKKIFEEVPEHLEDLTLAHVYQYRDKRRTKWEYDHK